MSSAQSIVDWQSTKNTVLERNRHMLNNSDMSDISFTCEGSHKTFYAHKYVLATSSAVFHAMFYGAWVKKDSILHLCDTTEEGFEQFLRFLYTDECDLNTDNAFAVMDLAKFYIVPSLSEKCVNFLLENLNHENVLDVLEQANRFDEKELEKRCWDVIASNTGRVVASDAFNNISQTTVTRLLVQDTLSIPEAELFQAVSKWIDFQCCLKNLEPTNENRRSIIGEAIYGFRFFNMSQTEFVQHVCKSGLLTPDEIVPIHEKFLGIDSASLKWKHPNRKLGRIVRYTRFSRNTRDVGWGYVGDEDRLSFSVDDAVVLHGVRLFGDDEDSEYDVTLQVQEAKVTGTYTSELNQDGIPGFDVMLKTPIKVQKDDVVTLRAKIEGPVSFYSEDGVSTVTHEGVSVTFSDALGSNNGTDSSSGQFHEIILWIDIHGSYHAGIENVTLTKT